LLHVSLIPLYVTPPSVICGLMLTRGQDSGHPQDTFCALLQSV